MQVRSLMSIMLVAVVCAGLTAATYAQNGEPDTVIHVDIVNGSTSPPNHGQNGWGGDAYKFLQDALDAAAFLTGQDPDFTVDIWVAHTPVGSQNQSLHYRPDQRAQYCDPQYEVYEPCGNGDPDESFRLIDNVRILGGFEGGEQFESQRDPENNITILSGDLADDDVIDDSTIPHDYANYCENSRVVVLANGVDNSAVLDGFVIQNGQGGEVEISPQLSKRTAGGLVVLNGSPIIRNCVFRNNINAAGVGGGGNQIASGGAVAVMSGSSGSSSPEFWSCTFKHNRVYDSGGGAIFVEHDNVAAFIDCHIKRNWGGFYAGGAIVSGDASFVNCSFIANASSTTWGGEPCHENPPIPEMPEPEISGGAALVTVTHGDAQESSSVSLWNCVIISNKTIQLSVGAVLIQDSDSEIINSTVAYNTLDPVVGSEVGGIYLTVDEELSISNSIVWHNVGDQLGEGEDDTGFYEDATITATYSNIEGGWGDPSDNNQDEDPMFTFVSPGGTPHFRDAVQLRPQSPSIHAGNTDLLPCDLFDIAPDVPGVPDQDCSQYPGPDQKIPVDLSWQERVRCIVDMGAFEYQDADCVGDVSRNGEVGLGDLLMVLDNWGTVQTADQCMCDINEDGIVDLDDLLAILDNWGDCENPVPEDPPESVEDCFDRYEDDPEELEKCLEWIEQQEDYQGEGD